MDFRELENQMHSFVTNQGWYKEDSHKKQTPRNLAVSLVIEASEVLEHFQWQGEFSNEDALAGELADVALYLIQLSSVCGIDLEEAVLQKLALNSNRKWPEP